MTPILFAQPGSVYHSIPGTDVYDQVRDARTWKGGVSLVAHPPCAQWSRMRHFATVNLAEKSLAVLAVRDVRRFGGILEHPNGSTLWQHCRLPKPGRIDRFGGYTLPILQQWFGHLAEKATWLYIVGCSPDQLPSMPFVMGDATHAVDSSKRGKVRRLKLLSKAKRTATPIALAEWMVEVARRCQQAREAA